MGRVHFLHQKRSASHRNCCIWRPWRGTCYYACSVLVSLGIPIGADGLAGQDHTQGSALATIAMATGRQRAPLTVLLPGERTPGTEDGPGPVFAGAAIGASPGGG